MIGALLTLVIYILVLGLLYWLCGYLLGVFPLPDPLNRIARAAVNIILALALCSILLGVLGACFDLGLPRWRYPSATSAISSFRSRSRRAAPTGPTRSSPA